MMPLLWLSLSFVFGLLLGSQFAAGWIIWLALGISLVAVAAEYILFRDKNPKPEWYSKWRGICPLPIGVILAVFLIGILRFPPAPQWTAQDLAFYNDRGIITVTAVIDALPEEGDRTDRVLLSMESLVAPDGSHQPLNGLALVSLSGRTDWCYGDRVELTGSPVTPPEDETFSYKDYLAHSSIYSLFTTNQVSLLERDLGNPILKILNGFRLAGYQTINKILPQPEAALLNGILLGLDRDIPADLNQAFQATGTAHIIAISGFNITIVAGIFYWLFRKWMNRWNAALASITGIFLYSIMVGAGASVMRAAIMGSMAILGRQINRRGAGLNTLAFTAAVMCGFNPLLPWDASFQLTFSATLGLVLLSDPMNHKFEGWLNHHFSGGWVSSTASFIGDFILVTLAAQITTLPVILLQFQRVSLSAVIANPLALPPQAALMVLGGVALLAGMLFQPLGQVLAWLAWPLAAYTNRLVISLSGLHWDFATSVTTTEWVITFYIVIILLYLFRTWLNKLFSFTAIILVVGLVTLLVWRTVLAAPDQSLHIILPGISEGQAIFIQTPLGNHVLVNGAAKGNLLSASLDQRLSPLQRRLDGLVITGTKSTTLAGLTSTIEHMPVLQLFWGSAVPSNWNLRAVEQSVHDQGGSTQLLQEGMRIGLDQSIEMDILANTDQCTSLMIQYELVRVLIPGGCPLKSLLAAHPELNGSLAAIILAQDDLTETTEQAWEKLQVPVVLWNDADSNLPVSRWIGTRDHGSIELTSNGHQISLFATRP